MNVRKAIEGKEVVAMQPHGHSGLQGYQMALTIEDNELVRYTQTGGSRFGIVKFAPLKREALGDADEAIKKFFHVAVLIPQRHYRPLTLADRNLLIG